MSVVVYSAEWCLFCKDVKELLTKKGIDYEVIDVDERPEDMMVLVKEGKKTIPQVFIEGVYIGGYTDTLEYLS